MSESRIWFLQRNGWVYKCEGEQDEDRADYIYFPELDHGIDHTSMDDGDECHVHVDELFETEAAATVEAIAFCKRKIEQFQKKLAKLEEKLPTEEWVDSHV